MKKIDEKIKNQKRYDRQNAYNSTHYKRCNLSFGLELFDMMETRSQELNLSVNDYIRKLIFADLETASAPQPDGIGNDENIETL